MKANSVGFKNKAAAADGTMFGYANLLSDKQQSMISF